MLYAAVAVAAESKALRFPASLAACHACRDLCQSALGALGLYLCPSCDRKSKKQLLLALLAKSRGPPTRPARARAQRDSSGLIRRQLRVRSLIPYVMRSGQSVTRLHPCMGRCFALPGSVSQDNATRSRLPTSTREMRPRPIITATSC